jgi:hypothetical protein
MRRPVHPTARGRYERSVYVLLHNTAGPAARLDAWRQNLPLGRAPPLRGRRVRPLLKYPDDKGQGFSLMSWEPIVEPIVRAAAAAVFLLIHTLIAALFILCMYGIEELM